MMSPHTSRRSVLLLGGLALVGCAASPSIPRVTASPTGSIREQLQTALDTVSAGNERLGVALKDLNSGASWDFRGDYASQSASMAKPMIVSMAMRQARAAGGPLSAENLQHATAAITQSKNDDADALWASAGGRPAYDDLAKDLGLTATRSDPARDFWSWTWTTPKDQLLFLQQLLNGTKALDDADRATLLSLMGSVTDDQAWGVGAPRGAEVAVQLKNGWVQFQSTDKLWAVNSIGHVKGQGRDYLLTIMTRTADFDTGRAYCDEIGSWVFKVLGSGPLR
ncbi:MAG: serine hydrolase [Micropruina sp.]|nr:serine hydrolase [Micropruina sp.]